ncbi:MAG: TRAP transporter small permease subunit [Gammaproteobacteria bacterium]|nr:TRAP transporter small permease subunit [Gammaproteobacteria bacterium]
MIAQDKSLLRQLIIAPRAAGPLGALAAGLDTLTRAVCAVVLWLTFTAILAPTFANAVLRYTTNASLVWSVEIVQLTFPWFIMAGAVLAAQHGRHIGIAVFIAQLRPAAAKWLRVLVQLLILLACFAIITVYIGGGMFEGGMAFAAGDVIFTSLGVPQSFSYLALLCGYILLGLTAAVGIYRLLYDGAREDAAAANF